MTVVSTSMLNGQATNQSHQNHQNRQNPHMIHRKKDEQANNDVGTELCNALQWSNKDCKYSMHAFVFSYLLMKPFSIEIAQSG